MRIVVRSAAVVLLSLCSLIAALPQTESAAKKAQVKFREFRLENGLRLIVAEDHHAPVYSIAVSYNVGSRDERRGRTGFAHLFEHMMFKGSGNVGDGEHSLLIANNGGGDNGTTDEDRTLYYETLPKNQLDLGMFLEADRMSGLDITQESLDNQRNAVQEERRLRVDNQPYGKTFETVSNLAYENFAYQHSVIGSMDDLNAASVDDVKKFFSVYYAPNNAVVAIVGDVNTDEVLAKAKQYFGKIKSNTAPPQIDMDEPTQEKEKRTTIEDPLARLPRISVAYHISQGETDDYFALSLLSTILSSGQSSRLYTKLVKRDQVATGAFGFAEDKRGPGLFQLSVSPRPGKDLGEIEKTLYAELDRFKKEPVTDSELQKAKNFAIRSHISSMSSSLGIAVNLADDAVNFNDPNLINTEVDKLLAVKKEDIMRVANKYFTDNNRTVVITQPKAKPAGNQ
ncbi:MAG TPA: pitrilysin family protein [Blastocatellia bacterium]|nr:pitrilysin family protein [Blastocatellia bacterium]